MRFSIIIPITTIALLSGCASSPMSPEYQELFAVNKIINETPYVEDSLNYGVGDYYATPEEFYQNGGDCEDYSIAKYHRLKEMGYSPSQLWLVHGENQEGFHNILLVEANDGNTYVLDYNHRAPILANKAQYFSPIVRFNENTNEAYIQQSLSSITKEVLFDNNFQTKIDHAFHF